MTLRKILVIQDNHHPFHDVRAWNLMLKAGRAWKPDIIAHTGDHLDAYAISDHQKRLEPRGFEWEIEEANKGLDQIEGLGATDHYFCAGNHEFRADRYMMAHPELGGMLSIPKLLRFRQRGWKYTPYREHFKLGKVYFTHDVESHSRQHKFKALGVYQTSVVTGHDHRLVYVVEGNALGETKLSCGFGWLGDAAQADYRNMHLTRTQWALGFGVGYIDTTTGYNYLIPVPIINYSCMVEGRVYRG